MGQPKALLKIGDETFAERLVRVFGFVCRPVILVTGAHKDIYFPEATVLHNPGWSSGQLTSLQAGLRAIPAETPAAFFAPVDCPMFTADTVSLLWNAYRAQPALFIIPQMNGRRGHPVLASRPMIEEILALPESSQARDVVHAHRDQTTYVEVTDPGIFSDIDTPEDYARLAVHP